MERQTGAEDSAQHQLVCRHIHLRRAQRCLHVARLIVERLAQFVGDQLAHAHYVVAEQEAVRLIVFVAHLRHVLVDDRVLFAEVDYFHCCLSLN